MPIHSQKILFWGVRTPKRDWSSSRPPKGTSLPELRLHANFGIFVQVGPLVRPVREMKKSKKKRKKGKKARKETYSGKLGVRPDHPRWRSDMWSCMPGGLREVVISFKFSQNRLNGFRDVGVEICNIFSIPKPVHCKRYKYKLWLAGLCREFQFSANLITAKIRISK